MLATKIHDTAAASGWLAALEPGQCLLVAQNGVGHRERLAPLTQATVVPVLVYVNAERTGRGCVRARVTGRGLVMPEDAPGRRAADLFSGSELAAETVADFRTAEWEKLLSNVTANPLTALTGRRAEVLREPPVAELAMDLLREAIEILASGWLTVAESVAVRTLACYPIATFGAPACAPHPSLRSASMTLGYRLTGSSAGRARASGSPCPHLTPAASASPPAQ